MSEAHAALAAVYRNESRRVLATLVRLLGDLDAAEEGLHDACIAAAEQWPRDGVPANPRAWLVSAGRFKALDRRRRAGRHAAALPEVSRRLLAREEPPPSDDATLADDELRLFFVCCHPALPPNARVALTLREVAGLRTEDIAHATLVPPATVAQRIVRAKAKIRDARIPYEVPGPDELPERLESVLRVLYLVYNEGYGASAGAGEDGPPDPDHVDLAGNAVRLARILAGLLADPEVLGLLALLLLNESRRRARFDAHGDLVLLADQDRTLWDATLIGEARSLIETAFRSRAAGPFLLLAAIAELHARAACFADTDWQEIVALYDLLERAEPSPVVRLNRAVALGFRDGAAAGLAAVDAALAGGELTGYPHAHAARADFARRLGFTSEARASYERALALTRLPAERRFLERRLRELTEPAAAEADADGSSPAIDRADPFPTAARNPRI